jgi:hypothetical protein
MGIEQLIHDVKPKHLCQSRPGRVGSLGDTVVKTRFRQSTPFMPWAYDPYWAGDRANKLGSNVVDGDTLGYDSLGGPARTFDSKWTGNRSFKHMYGFEQHDVQSLIDKSAEPVLSWLGDFSWRRKLANTSIIKRSGSLFNVQPHGYNGRGRGGNYPFATTSGGIDRQQEYDQSEPLGENAGISRIGAQPIISARDVFGNVDRYAMERRVSNVRAGVSGLNLNDVVMSQRSGRRGTA